MKDAADRLLQLIDATCTHQRKRVYRFDMKVLLDQGGSRPLASLTADDLLSYRSSLTAKFKPWTINHRLAIARRMLRLADELGWVRFASSPGRRGRTAWERASTANCGTSA